MKLKIRKDRLKEALDKMHEVSTKSIRTEYDFADRVTVCVEKEKVVFLTSNGHLDARLVLTEKDDKTITDGNETGVFTVKASKMLEMISKIKTESLSSPLLLTEDDDMLEDDTPNITVNGTTCAGGDLLAWQGAIDATASATAIETLAVIVGVKMEYTSTIGD